jgi:hypothetical protein
MPGELPSSRQRLMSTNVAAGASVAGLAVNVRDAVEEPSGRLLIIYVSFTVHVGCFLLPP